jgi:hypothetical protein
MPMGKRNSLGVAGVVVAAVLGGQPQPAHAQFRCVVIQPGETAAAAARRITGDAASQRALWFQIVDPTASRFVPKTEYGRVRAGWRACISEGTTAGVTAAPRADRPVPSPAPSLPPGIVRLAGMPEVWMSLTLLLAAMAGTEMARTSAQHRALARAMTPFGERFVREVELPLRRPGAAGPAMESRLRCLPGARQLEIRLAPRGRGSYPNLSDHRSNVEYDVDRVLRLLNDDRFVPEGLSAQGRWVIVHCRFRSERELGG